MEDPQMTRCGAVDAQACVPEGYTDAEVVAFAESRYPSGTELGWRVRKEGDRFLEGAPERVPCAERSGYVHVMLDA